MVDSFDENVIEGSNTENAYCEALYNTVPCALFTVDKEYKITCWNKRAEKITGYLAEDVLGKDCSLFEIESCFTGNELVFDGAIMPVIDKVCTIKDKQGNILTISKNIDILRDIKGNITGGIISFENITERIKNETLLELMTKTSPLAFLVVDNRTDKIMYFNHKFCQIWGITHIEDQMQRGELTNNQIIPYCLPVLADIPAFAESCKPLQSEDNRITIEDYIPFVGNKTVRRYSTQMRGANDEYFGRFYIFEDITEKKNIEDKLRESEENFRTFFHTVDDLIFVGNAEGLIIHTNDAVINKLGYLREELEGMHLLDLHPAEIRDEAEHVLYDLLSGKRSTCPLPLKSKSGNLLSVETKIWLGKWNGVDCIYGVSKDLTIQQAALDKFQKLFDSNPALMAVSSLKDNSFQDVNTAFIDKLGYSRDEIVGKTSAELNLFIDPDKQIEASKILQKNGNIRNVELQARRKDGQVIDGLFSGEIIDNQFEKSYLSVMTDITEQKIVENELLVKDKILSAVALSIKELLDNRDYYSAISNCFKLLGEASAVDRVYIFQNYCDESGIRFTSQKIEWNSGNKEPQINNPELQNVPFHEISYFIEPLEKGEAFYGIVRCFKNDRTRALLESQGILSIVVLPVFVKKQFWGFVGFDECKFERRWIEAEYLTLSAFVNALEKAIERAQIEEELELARKTADVANVAKSQFLANMSHEIRTPMNAVIAYSELLSNSNLTQKQQNYISKIMISSNVLLTIINDILDLNKMEASMIKMETIPFKLDVILNNATSQVRVKSDNKGLKLKVEIDKNVITDLNGDPLRLQQILTNLIDNAVKFTNNGGVDIRVKSIENDSNHALLLFSISDTGIGIVNDQIENIFEPFSQTDADTSRKYGGTGLGLAICKNLVNLYGGEIWVESTLGEGTTFFFTAFFSNHNNLLTNLSNEMKGTEKTSHADTIEQIRGSHVLLVEDNEVNQDVMIEILQTADLIVTVANNGIEAINYVKANEYDIILMDIRMPEMDGFEAATEIRKIKALEDLPIIAVTAGTMLSEREINMRNCFNDYITKPVNIAGLLQKMARFIKNRQKPESANCSLQGSPKEPLTHVEIIGDAVTIRNLDGIDINILAKRLGGNQKFMRNLLIKFRENQNHVINDIYKALGAEDYKTAERLAHSVKGLASIIEAPELYKIAAELEAGIHIESLEKIEVFMAKLDQSLRLDELEEVKSQLEVSLIQEEMQKPLLTKEQVIFWIHKFRKFDLEKFDHRQRLVDSFINAIYVYDDKVVFTFNYKDGNKTVSFADIESSDLKCFGAPT